MKNFQKVEKLTIVKQPVLFQASTDMSRGDYFPVDLKEVIIKLKMSGIISI